MGFRELGFEIWDESERLYKRRLADAVPRVAEGRMLDVGCDDGDWTDVIRERAGLAAQDVSGLEIVDERRALATERGFTVVAADLEQRWPLDDGEFALVHANQVIEHVKRLDHFVTEIHRVLRPGGYAVICTENLASWHNIAALIPGWQPFSITNLSATGPIGNPLALHDESHALGESWQHIHVVTLRALVDVFAVHGFVIEHRFAAGYYPLRGRPAAWMAMKNPGHGHFIGLRARRL